MVSVQAGVLHWMIRPGAPPSGEATAASLSDASPVYPLKASADSRFLVDQLDRAVPDDRQLFTGTHWRSVGDRSGDVHR